MSRLTYREAALVGVPAVLAAAIVLGAAWMMSRSPDGAISGLPRGGAPPAASDEKVPYTLVPGRSAEDIGKDLVGLGIIRSALQFRVLVSFMGLEHSLSAGDYLLPANSSASTIVSLLTVRPSIPVISVTFPEGIRIEEMAVLAEEAGFGLSDDFLVAARTVLLPEDFMADLPPDADRQGYLFPDTYIMPEGSLPAELVALMVETLDRRFTPELRRLVREQGLTLHEALTLASIIEREAVLADERPIMAGVFLNRLEEGIPLGADPTVQFAVAEDFQSVLAYGHWKTVLAPDDYEVDSPYNTYIYPDLPPGPITNPGLASIEAVAMPADTSFYYFVADAVAGDGSHRFAETLAEHQRNIAEYGQQ